MRGHEVRWITWTGRDGARYFRCQSCTQGDRGAGDSGDSRRRQEAAAETVAGSGSDALREHLRGHYNRGFVRRRRIRWLGSENEGDSTEDEDERIYLHYRDPDDPYPRPYTPTPTAAEVLQCLGPGGSS